jgi:hypothetical protein
MRRLLLTLALLPAAGATPAAAADHCRARPAEHAVARSAQAVVLTRTPADGRTVVIGCSRRTGHRRVVGRGRIGALRLAGTRIAYVAKAPAEGLVADDALHRGRRHDLANPLTFERDDWLLGGRPDAATGRLLFVSSPEGGVGAFAVDDQGDVAWTTGAGTLVAWRPGLGSRQVDARAAIDGLALRSGVLRWRRDGAAQSVDLKRVPRSACAAPYRSGTLVFDAATTNGACLRADGRVAQFMGGDSGIIPFDANGTYVVYRWAHVSTYGTTVENLADGTTIDLDPTPADPSDAPFGEVHSITDAVVDGRGAYAWVTAGALWVHDGAGTRPVAGTGTGPLQRDGSTVTWSDGGPTVTLNP